MQLRNEVWQGYSGYWQNYFMQQNLLLLGYAAWDSYLNQGRGVLTCKITDIIPASIDWQTEWVKFTQQFIPQPQIASYLQESGLEPAAIDPLIQAVATYDPAREMVILIQGNGAVDINLLRPKITPPSCYDQVKQRWAEFQLDCSQLPWRSYG
ncbi:MAG: hypothetical protein IGS38_20120 [Synechococcales cyanobacterium M58_A2018_015]|nr:hypothetical protein [Synechococcales cyanobacterium M58_A2018_015]